MLATTVSLAAAILAALILTAGVIFQILLAAGLPMGRAAWGGAHQVLPPLLRAASLVAALVLIAAVWIVLARAGLLQPSADLALVRTGAWLMAGVFAVYTAANALSPSIVERRTMTPAALVLCLCFVVVAMS